MKGWGKGNGGGLRKEERQGGSNFIALTVRMGREGSSG